MANKDDISSGQEDACGAVSEKFDKAGRGNDNAQVISKIRELLRQSPLELDEIAYVTKYENLEQMNTMFMEAENKSPQSYRDEQMEKLKEDIRRVVSKFRKVPGPGEYFAQERHTKVKTTIKNSTLPIKDICDLYNMDLDVFKDGFQSVEGCSAENIREKERLNQIKRYESVLKANTNCPASESDYVYLK